MPLYILAGTPTSGSGVSGLTPNQVLFGDANGLIGQATNFTWNGIGLGAAAADAGSRAFAVSGTMGLSGSLVADGIAPNILLLNGATGFLGRAFGNTSLGGTADGGRRLAVTGTMGVSGSLFVGRGDPASGITPSFGSVAASIGGIAARFSDNSRGTLDIDFPVSPSIRLGSADANMRILLGQATNLIGVSATALVISTNNNAPAYPGSLVLAVTGAVGATTFYQSDIGATSAPLRLTVAPTSVPTTTWTTGTPNNNPSGYLQLAVTGSARFIPYWQ